MRNLILTAIGCLSVYLLWLLFHLLRGRRRANEDALSFSDHTADSAANSSQILRDVIEPSVSTVHIDGERYPAEESLLRKEPSTARLTEPDAGEFGFDALLELRQTRHLFDELKSSHDALQVQVNSLAQELHALRAACQVSPVYSEAVALAQRGYEVDAIAERCGISLAEAQLVQSLTADSLETSNAKS